jgi:two-component SAPR family response regulator
VAAATPAATASSAGAAPVTSPAGNAPGPAARAPAPPIEVICLGGPRVLCAGRQVWPRRVGGDAKPWEFLLFLACQTAEGVSTGQAVEALWPDADVDNPPHSFRQLRYRLRLALVDVPGAPETDGIFLDRGILKVDPGVIRSDATAFLEEVRTARTLNGADAIARLERARSLYLGDLLEGPDARRYAWVDERDDSGVTLREHFRRHFQLASTRLAELYAQAADHVAAIEVYRELTEIDPGDERLWTALFRLHAERGDRLALIREEHRLREALHELAGSDSDDDMVESVLDGPSRQLAEEYQRLLSRLRDGEREIAHV